MKRVLSLLLAAATALGLTVASFAATDDVTTYDNNEFDSASTRVYYGNSSTNLNLAAGELLLMEDKDPANNPAVILPDARLIPGNDYYFRVYKSNSQQTNQSLTNLDISPVTKGDLGDRKIRLSNGRNTSVISGVTISERGTGSSAYIRVKIETREAYGTNMTETSYRLTTSGNVGNNANTAALTDGTASFKVGWGRFTDEEIDDLGDEETITISNDKSVILKDQFKTLAKNYDYKAIEFISEDPLWTFTGRVSSMGNTNFHYSRDVVVPIVEKFEDMDLEFVTFNAGVTFPTNGELRIDVSDFDESFSRYYVYLYRDGKLTPISSKFESGADELVFRTNYLGSFLITGEEITDTSIINPGETGEAEEPGEVPENPDNPNTGAANVGAVALLGIASLATAFVARKKK